MWPPRTGNIVHKMWRRSSSSRGSFVPSAIFRIKARDSTLNFSGFSVFSDSQELLVESGKLLFKSFFHTVTPCTMLRKRGWISARHLVDGASRNGSSASINSGVVQNFCSDPLLRQDIFSSYCPFSLLTIFLVLLNPVPSDHQESSQRRRWCWICTVPGYSALTTPCCSTSARWAGPMQPEGDD